MNREKEGRVFLGLTTVPLPYLIPEAAMRLFLHSLVLLAVLPSLLLAADPSADFFPIAVWLQQPRNAPQYKAIGINTYVGLWNGPTQQQLDDLEQAGMRVICHQNEVGLRNRNKKHILAWMHGDEPDNAQSLGQGKGWGPPIPPARIVEDYRRMKQADPSRPVLLNLGQGVAWDRWHGRGVRSNHPEDYPEYLKGCDIASFDIYPVTHDNPEVAGNLWFVARGVQRLVEWTGGGKPVWACIETTHISNPAKRPTPAQVKSEVWITITHGATGIIYFAHEFKPQFIEAGLLAHPDIAQTVKQINAQITELAPVLNSATLKDVATVSSPTPIATLCKKHDNATYVFAVAMRDTPATATFAIPGLNSPAKVEVLGENRAIEAANGRFSDQFAGYGVHLYRIR